ncbi:MAG TPA: alpha-ketoglutarate-dependent dioxygenase AlkB [Terriglobales bacterium]|nr:alpha-ketoglutarate-dependent dioxygenase AlkB [Terriglobales bacterium]
MVELIPLPGAELYYDADFLAADEASAFLQSLLNRCKWARRNTSFGYPVPRDEAYYGDPETQYTYSRRQYSPLPWLPELLELKRRVEEATPPSAYREIGLDRRGYNAVLCNLYKNGNDSVGLHADAEPEMGPVIASVSLGEPRLFRLKHKTAPLIFSRTLPHGSLLIMAGDTQLNFKHEVPKQPQVSGPRINLTFRRIHHHV